MEMPKINQQYVIIMHGMESAGGCKKIGVALSRIIAISILDVSTMRFV